MLQRKFYRSEVCTKPTVPFSWEVKPGVCKLTDEASRSVKEHLTSAKLRPPPSTLTTRSTTSMDDSHVSSSCLSCAPRPSMRSPSFRMAVRKEDDPFLAAYKSCTASPATHRSSVIKERNVGFGKRKSMHFLPGKYSFPVSTEGNPVRLLSWFARLSERK